MRWVFWLAGVVAVGLAAFAVLNLHPVLRLLYPVGYAELIDRWAREQELDPFLVAAVIRVESKFNPRAVSPRGARGLMQLMPETARWIAEQTPIEGFDGDDHLDQLFVPSVNIQLGTWYLSFLHNEFGGRREVALAAYNGGRGNVERWLSDGLWSGEMEELHRVPFAETREFVRRVTQTAEFYARIYGGNFENAIGQRQTGGGIARWIGSNP